MPRTSIFFRHGRRRTVPAGPLLLLLLFAVSSCARTFNYTDPHGPRYAFNRRGEPVGVPAPGRDAAPASRSGSADRDLRLVTFNVKFGRRIGAALKLLRTNPELNEADVICLQEMDEDGVRLLAEGLGMNAVYYPAVLHPADHRDFGNAVLSRWPIVADHKLILPHLGRTRESQRIAVAATLLAGGDSLRVYSVHLATPFEVGPAGRRDQAHVVLEDAARFHGPVIVAGDFNSHGLGEEFRDAGYLWPSRHLGPTMRYFDLDHIFLRGFPARESCEAGIVRENLGASDHSPVWAELSPLPQPSASADIRASR